MEEKKIHCTLTDLELAAKADQLIDELIKSGGKSFTMQVPARPNSDTDLIFAELNNRFKKMITDPKGPVWVKARGGMLAGIYSMKLVSRDNVEMRGTGLVNHGVIQLITFLNKSTMGIDDLPKDYEGVYYLDESAAGREEIERRNKLIEDNLKLNCRLNMPGISQQEQECAWAAYKLKHNL